MNKLKYILLFILTISFVQAQDELNLPNYTPPSPEAAAMTKYADLQANEFKGMVSHTIPLHTYKAGQLEVPVSISYNGAGVRVDDIPTWVGINWTLNAGGVITRTVKDLPDENVMQRLMPTEADVAAYNSVTDGTTDANFLWNVAESSQQIDSEVDVFQFNFNGFSGSFYFDENWRGRPFNDEQNFKITAIDRNQFYNQKYIYIITPDGVKYTFGGVSATEDTTLRYVVDGSVTPGDTNQGTTAYYLINIKHPVYGEVNFQYESLDTEILTTQKIKKLRTTKQYEHILHNGNCGVDVVGTQNGGGCNTDPSLFDCSNREDIQDRFSGVTISSRVLNPKYLKRITSSQNNEIITFNSERVDNPSFKRVLSSIIIENNNNGQIVRYKTIDFEYYGFSQNPHPFATTKFAQKRFFLTRISYDKDVNYATNTVNGRRNQVYEFEYNGYELPNRFDFSQDYGGFYNGINNSTSIPNNIVFNPYGLHNLADRTPNFNLAKTGSLKRIYYPTGGFTEFDYEASRKAKKKNYKPIVLQAWRNMGQYNYLPNNKLTDGIPQIDPQGNYIGIKNVYENQSVNVNVKLKVHREQGDVIIAQNERAVVKLKDINTNNETFQTLVMNSDNNGLNNNGVIEKDFTINYGLTQGHEYEISIEIEPTTNNDPLGMEANLHLEYYDGYSIVDDFGVRLKRMTDYTKIGQPENIKRYYYSKMEDAISPININSLPILGEGNLYVKIENYTSNKICNPNTSQCSCDLPPSMAELWYFHTELNSETINFYNSPILSNYEYVSVSLGGDSFEKGGIEKKFRLADDYGGTKIETDLSGAPSSFMHSFIEQLSSASMNIVRVPNPMNGILLHEKYFVTKDGAIKKILFNDYQYMTSEDVSVRNIFSKKEYDALFYGNGSQNINNTISNFTLAVYKIPSLRNEISQKQTIQYIDPVPLGVTNEAPYNKVVTIENYDYGIYKGLPTKVTTTTSEGSLVEVNNYYVDQANNPVYQNGLSPNQIQAVMDLQSQNIVNKPILTEKIKDTKIINKVRTIYKDLNFEMSTPRIVPHIIESDKGEDVETIFEPRVVFHEYDNSGRPTLVSLANGTKTRYWYNALGQVIMKAKNYISGSGGTITESDIIQQTNSNPCAYINSFSNSVQVTIYQYQPVTNLLVKIIDPKCDQLIYEYDALHRLKMIKDKDGNIIQEFDTSFKRY